MHPESFDSLAVETGHLPRRALLGSAAAGLGLAITGLFTSVGLDEGGAGGKHKGKKRRAKKRKKTNGNPAGAPGQVSLKNVRMVVENLTANSLYFKGVVLNESRKCPTRDLQTIAPNTAPTFAPGYWNAYGMVLDSTGLQYAFGVADQDPQDGFPIVDLGHGGSLTKDQCWVGVSTDVVKHEMGVGMSLERTIQKFRFVIKRENDIESDRVFRVQIHDVP